jgi:Isochorismatase family
MHRTQSILPVAGRSMFGTIPISSKPLKRRSEKTLIIAGTITSVCLAFPSISALNEGYKVFAMVDTSGTYSKMAQEITLTRLLQAGAIPIDTAAVCSEIQQTWSRSDAAQWAEAYASLFPPYQLLIESYNKAQEVAVKHEVLDSQRDTAAAAG